MTLAELLGGQRTGDRDARAEHLRDDIAGDRLRRQPDLVEDLIPGGVIEELVRQTQLRNGGVDAGRAQILTDAGADPGDPYAVFDRDHDAVLAGEAR